MQALSDDQQIGRLEGRMDGLEGKVDGLDQKVDRLDMRVDRLETKMENGFAEVRSEARADFRTLVGVQLTTLVAMILGFAGIILQQVWS
jgi:archaellum component FlaC